MIKFGNTSKLGNCENNYFKEKSTRDKNRTCTSKGHQILNLARLPVSPPWH